MKKVLVLGAGGFIGHHLVKRLKNDGHWVRAVDLKLPEFETSPADDFCLGNLQKAPFVEEVAKGNFDEVFQLAADMGGAGYLFTGEHDADVMSNSALINLHVARLASEGQIGKLFYSSSACIYPKYNQADPHNPKCQEDAAYPADPDSEYGWEKLFSERMYLSYARNYQIPLRIARFHNVFGPLGAWTGGKEKAPAAICRKVAEAPEQGEIEIWGDGLQTRSFLYIDDCVEGMVQLMASDYGQPVNIGSEEMVSINELAQIIIGLSGKSLTLRHIEGPTGVRGRNSDNTRIRKHLGWEPVFKLKDGLKATYNWIDKEVRRIQNPRLV